MPWFMVDDSFHSHKKAARAGAAALGLWVLAGSWAAQHLSDGWVPDYIAAKMDPNFGESAAALVRAGLWVEDEQDGEKGWSFHEWDQIQRSRSEVLEKRAEARDRMKKVREIKAKRSQSVRANETRTSDEPTAKFARSSQSVRSTPALPSPTQPIEKPSSANEIRDDVESVCTHLADKIEANGSKRPVIGKRWRDAARLMIDADGRTEQQILKAIDWCQASDFWRGNVMSMPTLRTKYDQLRLAAQRTTTTRNETPASTAPDVIPESEKCEHRKRAATCGLCRAEQIGTQP
jgi:hypothetical protein